MLSHCKKYSQHHTYVAEVTYGRKHLSKMLKKIKVTYLHQFLRKKKKYSEVGRIFKETMYRLILKTTKAIINH